MLRRGLTSAIVLTAALLMVPADGRGDDLPDWREVTSPGAGTAPQVFGGHARGCLDGAVPLPLGGVGYQVMRPQRNRFWGHPALIDYIERLAAALAVQGWPGLLIGDLSQPRGGPMPGGHRSHQTGLDVDIWFASAPPVPLTDEERERLAAVSVVAAGGDEVGAAWTEELATVLRTAAGFAEVDRIFVNATIKRELCRTTGDDREWLSRLRPWWGHDDHFHVGLRCPMDDAACLDRQPPVPAGDGCGSELDWWFSAEARGETGAKPSPPPKRPTLEDLPPACRIVLMRP